MSNSLSDTQLLEPPRRTGVAARLADTRPRPALVAMVVLTLLASAVNYGSSLIFSRVLTPESFGDLTALLALAVVIAVPTAAAQTRLAARVAAHNATGNDRQIRYVVRYAVAHVCLLGTMAMLVYVTLIPLVDQALNLQALGAAIALAPVVWLAFPVPIVLGVLQGLDRYIAFGVMSVAIAISRPAFGVPWAEAGGGAGGALAGQAIGNIVVLLTAAVLLRRYWFNRGSGAGTAGLRRRPDIATLSASGAFVAFAVIANFDVLLAKLFLEPRDVGLYAGLATVAKILIFLPGAIAVALVPNAARAAGDLRARSRALRMAALAVVGTTVFVAVPMALMPDLTLRLMFGEEYRSAASGVLPMLFAGTGLALLYLLVVYSVTIEDRRWMLLLVMGVALQAIGIALFHDSPTEIAMAQAAAIGIVLLANEALFHSLFRPLRRAVGDAG